jgi:predicted permease
MIKAALQLVYPILAVLSFWVIRIDRNLLWLPFFGLLLHLVPGLLSCINAKKLYSQPADRGSYILSAILSNQLILGGISVYILYGETGFAYVQLAVLLQGMILFLGCFPLAQYYQHVKNEDVARKQIAWWSIVFNRNQIAVLGILAGIILNKTGVTRPAIGSSLFDIFVHINAWMSLIPVGHSIRFGELRGYLKDTWSISAIKFIFTPVILAGLAALFINDVCMRRSVLVLAFAPTAVNAVITVRLHDLNMAIVMTNFVVTTALYLLVVYPVLFFCLS